MGKGCVTIYHKFLGVILISDDSSLLNLDQQVSELPSRFADLCLKAFTARQEVIDWVKDMVQNEDAVSAEIMLSTCINYYTCLFSGNIGDLIYSNT